MRIFFHKHPKSPAWFVGFVVLLMAAAASSRPFWPGELARTPWMTFVRDDFFYYLVIARHMALGHGSTFNGIAATNGYHPLWMLLLAAVCRVSISAGAVLGYVAVTATISTIMVYGLALRLLGRFEIAGWHAVLGAAYVALCSLPICFYGMEATLAVPAALALALHVLRWQETSVGRWWFSAGVLTSLLVLARVDAVLLAGLLVVALLSITEVRASFRPQHGAALAAGCVPVVAYFLINRFSFGLWLPVSGIAKQLRHGWRPSVNVWASVLDGPRSAWLNLLLVVLALALLAMRWRGMAVLPRAVLGVLLLYPLLFVLLLSVRSDWEMWPWYAWIWRPATCAALTVLLSGMRDGPRLRAAAVAAMAVLILIRLPASMWRPGQGDFYDAALEVRAFAQMHPGTYAMGDRAGMIAWLLPEPLVQTEGLVMDRGFLEHIRRQDALLPVLRGYGVRYYIADDWEGGSLMHGGCFHAAEPAEAGPESPRMRGVLCGTPLLRVTHNEVTTLIYELPRAGDGDHQR